MPHVRANDLDIGYDVIGDGPPMVLLHAATSVGRETYAAQIPTLAARFRLYLPDARGHGRTRWDVADGFEAGWLVDDLEAFVDALDLDRFHLVGYSMGGMTALGFAVRAPERLRSLVALGIATAREPRASVARRLMDPARILRDDPAWAADLARLHDPEDARGVHQAPRDAGPGLARGRDPDRHERAQALGRAHGEAEAVIPPIEQPTRWNGPRSSCVDECLEIVHQPPGLEAVGHVPARPAVPAGIREVQAEPGGERRDLGRVLLAPDQRRGVEQHHRRTVADDVVADVEVVGADLRHRRDATAPVRAVRAGSARDRSLPSRTRTHRPGWRTQCAPGAR